MKLTKFVIPISIAAIFATGVFFFLIESKSTRQDIYNLHQIAAININDKDEYKKDYIGRITPDGQTIINISNAGKNPNKTRELMLEIVRNHFMNIRTQFRTHLRDGQSILDERDNRMRSLGIRDGNTDRPELKSYNEMLAIQNVRQTDALNSMFALGIREQMLTNWHPGMRKNEIKQMLTMLYQHPPAGTESVKQIVKMSDILDLQ